MKIRNITLGVAALGLIFLGGHAVGVNIIGFQNGGTNTAVPAQNLLNPTKSIDVDETRLIEGIATSTPWSSIEFDLSGNKKWKEGVVVEQVAINMMAPTYVAEGSSTSTFIGVGTMKIDRCPLAGDKVSILYCTNLLLGAVAGNQVNSDRAFGALIIPSGISDGYQNTTARIGVYVTGPPGGSTDLGDQVITLTDLNGVEVDMGTYAADAAVAVTNPAGAKFKAPVAGSNVTFTNESLGLWVASGASRFDGSMMVNTSTPVTDFDLHNASATTTMQITSNGAGLGGRMIVEDVDGAGCTEITALNGVVTSKTVTCP